MVAQVIDLVFNLLTSLLSILPASFVQSYLSNIGEINYLSYVNYFIPFYNLVKIGRLWLGCCAAYLIYYYARTVYDQTKKS